jgi:hypothetical protein
LHVGRRLRTNRKLPLRSFVERLLRQQRRRRGLIARFQSIEKHRHDLIGLGGRRQVNRRAGLTGFGIRGCRILLRWLFRICLGGIGCFVAPPAANESESTQQRTEEKQATHLP